MYNPLPTRLCALLIAALMGSTAYAQSSSSSSSGSAKPVSAQVAVDRVTAAQTRITDAIEVIGKMKADPKLNDLLVKAKGVVIVPHFMEMSLVFGGKGGSGLLVVRHDKTWTSPAFYKLGAGTFGVQLGTTYGSVALLLMSDKAVSAFENNASTWTMGAGAGLNALNYTTQLPEAGTDNDVIAWSDMKGGLYAGAALGATKVSRDLSANQAYYKSPDVTSQQILNGEVNNPDAKPLIDVMLALKASTPAPAPKKQ